MNFGFCNRRWGHWLPSYIATDYMYYIHLSVCYIITQHNTNLTLSSHTTDFTAPLRLTGMRRAVIGPGQIHAFQRRGGRLFQKAAFLKSVVIGLFILVYILIHMSHSLAEIWKHLRCLNLCQSLWYRFRWYIPRGFSSERALPYMDVDMPVSPNRFVTPASLIIYNADNSLWDEVTAATLMYGTFLAKLAVTVHFRGSLKGFL